MILVTRQRNLAAQSASELQKLGYKPLILPLLYIRHIEQDIEDKSYNALIFTSINAAEACKNKKWMNSKTAYAVGTKTAKALVDKKFTRIIHCDQENQNNLALIELIKSKENPGSKLLYISGDKIAGDIQGNLNTLGYNVIKKTVYQAIALESISQQAVESIQNGVKIVTLYSPRTASIFSNIAIKYNINLSEKIAVCISKNTAQALNQNLWKEVIVAKTANEESIIQTITCIKY